MSGLVLAEPAPLASSRRRECPIGRERDQAGTHARLREPSLGDCDATSQQGRRKTSASVHRRDRPAPNSCGEVYWVPAWSRSRASLASGAGMTTEWRVLEPDRGRQVAGARCGAALRCRSGDKRTLASGLSVACSELPLGTWQSGRDRPGHAFTLPRAIPGMAGWAHSGRVSGRDGTWIDPFFTWPGPAPGWRACGWSKLQEALASDRRRGVPQQCRAPQRSQLVE